MPPVEMVPVPRDGIWLELSLTLAETADANQVFGKVVKLVETLHAYEQCVGGAGLRWDRKYSTVQPGAVRLLVVPNRPADAEKRLQSLGELVRATVAEFRDVKEVFARVSGAA
jgi:hypothetical protein